MCIMCAYYIHRGYSNETKKEKPIRKTLLLDQTTIDILEEYGLFKSGDTTISNAIRVMARDYKENQWKK